MLLSDKMWGLFSKDPSKDFPYDLQEQIGQVILAILVIKQKRWTIEDTNTGYFREVNPYKKSGCFCKLFFVYTHGSRCPPFLFISDELIFKQSKKSMLQNNIYK